MKALFNQKIIAESGETQLVDGYYYFPPEKINQLYFLKSDKITHCPFKGVATYWHVIVDGKTLENAAWTYAEPKEAARHIGGHIGFWKDIQISE